MNRRQAPGMGGWGPAPVARSRSRSGRKAWVGIAASLMALLLVAACGGAASSGSAKTDITFSYLWTGLEGKSLEKIVNQFNKSQSQIHVTGVSSPDAQKQLAEMSSTSGGFDISDSFGWETAAYSSKGVVASLSPFMKQDGYSTKDFVKSAMEQMTYKGQIYGMPLALQDYMLIYSKKAFAAAGITSPPVTTSQWAADIAKTTKVDSSGNITQLGYFFPSVGVTTGSNQSNTTYSFGGNWYSSKGSPTADSAANIANCTFYVNNVPDKYGVNQVNKFTSGFGDFSSAQDPLYTGQLAMTVDGEWMSVMTQEYAPNFQWGVAPVPYEDGHPGDKDASQVDVSDLFIPSNSKHKQQAWDFMKYLIDKESMKTFSLALGNLPARYSLIDSPAYKNLPNFSVWLNELRSKNAVSLKAEPYSAEYTNDIGTALSNADLGRGSCASNLQQLQAKTKSYTTTG